MMDKDEIEILDLDDDEKVPVVNTATPSNIDNKETKPNKEVAGDKMGSKKVKKRRLKKGIFQTIFCLLSLAFIIGCCIFYGGRLIKYYRIYNPKTDSGESAQLISNALIHGTPIVVEGPGIYRENGVYVYKGEEVNNYIEYSNMLWRIVRTNTDGSLEIILDDYINILAWDFEGNDYINSDIHKYLNEVFIKQIDTSSLVKTTICTDKMETINDFTCSATNLDSYVKLLPANDFLNSVVDESTYIASDDDLIWLGTSGSDKVWHANGNNISTSEGNNTYFVKPVVTIKNSAVLLSGDGTKENPFQIQEKSNKIGVGSYITIDEDTWIVYEKNDNDIKLVYSTLYNEGLTTYRFDTEELDYDPTRANSLAELLNTEFYDSLSYKDMLLDFDVYTGTYDGSYENIYDEKVTVKVGIPSAVDLKFNNEEDGYYLSSKSPRIKIYYYKEDLISSNPGISRPIRPTISIEIPEISSGSGTVDDPFVIEVD